MLLSNQPRRGRIHNEKRKQSELVEKRSADSGYRRITSLDRFAAGEPVGGSGKEFLRYFVGCFNHNPAPGTPEAKVKNDRHAGCWITAGPRLCFGSGAKGIIIRSPRYFDIGFGPETGRQSG